MGTTKTPNKNTGWRKQKYFALRRGRDWSFFGKRVITTGSPVKFGCTTPVAHPSSDTLKSQVPRTPATPPVRPTSSNVKGLKCVTHSEVLVYFAFSGKTNAAAAFSARKESPGSWVGDFTIAASVWWVVSPALRTAFYFIRIAMTGLTANTFLSRNRVSPKEAFEGLELCEGKLSCTGLRELSRPATRLKISPYRSGIGSRRLARIHKTRIDRLRLSNANVATTKVIKLAKVGWLAAYDLKRRTRCPTAYRPCCFVI